MKKLNKKGFTIVELVIVIAVIAILAGVLIPTFSSIIKKANQSKAMQAARNEYELFLVEYAETLTGEENYVVVSGDYYFNVTAGQFIAEPKAYDSTESAKYTNAVDLTKKAIKSVKTGATVSSAPVADVTNYYTDEKCTGDAVTSGWTANTTYYYTVDVTIDGQNNNVAIYKPAA